jgi:uncharacterized protein (DUF697 family)
MKKLLLHLFAIWLGFAAVAAVVGVVKFDGGPLLAVFGAAFAAGAWRCWRLATGAVTPALQPETQRPWER